MKKIIFSTKGLKMYVIFMKCDIFVSLFWRINFEQLAMWYCILYHINIFRNTHRLTTEFVFHIPDKLNRQVRIFVVVLCTFLIKENSGNIICACLLATCLL
jgi:hypothetical protein